MTDGSGLDELTQMMKALGDPGRVAMIKLLEERPLCVCELTHCLELAQPTVSRHLKALEQAGLVERRRDGQWVEYSLPTEAPGHARTMLMHLRGWLENDERIRTMRERLRGADRNTLCGPRQ